ncbi:hypothetical protein N0V84_012500 [Fusarium piperis]|uniref:Uncharacterized protein n=1 Tax=Fusarium piperis TaxID=1435070 RepID=A0A9W8W283_9HYPO|nr:hypothetical protein N0V84_012500 [Fusarium piperis]
MSDELLSALVDIAKRFRGPQGKDNARFGHVALPKTHLANEDFLAQLIEAFRPYQGEDDYRIFIVVSEFEKRRAETDHAGLFSDPSAPTDRRPILLTFRELIAILESNRAGPINGEKGWKAASQSDEWNTDQVLPSRVFVFFNIQPCLPASCALALLGLMKWTLDISERPSSALRILTASDSSDIDMPIVSKLVRLHGSRPLESFDVSNLNPLAGKPNVQGFEEEAFSKGVSDAIEASISGQSGASTHIVLVFPSNPSAESLKESLEDVGINVEIEILNYHDQVPDISRVREMFSHLQPDDAEGPAVQIIILEPNKRPLMFLQGFTHAHIVLGSGMEIAFDRKTGQLVHAPIPLSQDTRQGQIAWSHQPHVENVHVYASSELEEFSRGGSRYFRLIEHQEAGGFIAAVFAMSPWGLNPTDALACFQFDTQVYQEMRHRLVTQDIIKANPSGLAMTGKMAAIFQAMLPIAKYDYRIAYFLAIPATPLVLHVKIQLAAILMIGIETLLLIEEESSLDELLSACWGYARCLVPTGTLWLLFGLWKRLVVDDQEAAGDPGFHRSTANGRVQSTVNELDVFKYNVKQIRKALAHLGLQLSSGDIALEDGDLFSDQCTELQYHLLCAYVHQLVATSIAGSEAQPRHTILSTGAEVASFGCSGISHLFYIQEAMAREDGHYVLYKAKKRQDACIAVDRDTP